MRAWHMRRTHHFGYWHAAAVNARAQELLQVAALAEFHRDANTRGVHERPVVPNDMRMLEGRQNLHL